MCLRKIISCVLLVCLSTFVPISASNLTNAVPLEIGRSNVMEKYRLSKYDVINVVVIGMPENSAGFSDIMLGPDGYANLPYAGTVKLAGLTIPEATELLREKLGEYIKIPSMAVMIKQYGPRQVYVMGEVAKQGIYSLGSEYMNVFAAISSAGGITKRGRPKHIAVVRMVDGKVQMQEVNFDKFVKQQDAAQNVRLQDGDMVYIPKSNKIVFTEDIMPIFTGTYLLKNITD
ncbi:polysaccharide export outer membrane protein [Pelosinus propionicus DSM 13327]|uniref:Polysaccharide export outer membrane protein n=1 Tax=Pelosinus propionicus DSM 13327 TaxID=1123291 RepID=A0A1I4MQ57_9FIRM|nr:polysaccharide export outer membrane protein [Pelosinus propionicus DSM 13327]